MYKYLEKKTNYTNSLDQQWLLKIIYIEDNMNIILGTSAVRAGPEKY